MKGLLYKIWREFLYGGYLAALGPASVVLCSMLLLNVKVSFGLLFFSYLIPLVAYLFDNFHDNYSSSRNIAHKVYLRLTTYIVILLLFIVYFLSIRNLRILYLTLFMIILSVLYNVLFKKFTKNILGFKSYYVALLFAIMPLFVLFSHESLHTASLIFIMIFFGLRAFSNTIFCDVKDIEDDSKKSLKTFAVAYSPERFKRFALFFNYLSAGIIVLGVAFKLVAISALPLMLIAVYYQGYIRHVSNNPSKARVISYLVADGEAIMWILLLLVGRLLWS